MTTSLNKQQLRTSIPSPDARELSISARDLTVRYGQHTVIKKLDIDIPVGMITTIIGPNGCGKSTLMKALCRLIPFAGQVMLGEKSIAYYTRKELAKHIGVLPQTPSAPEGIVVADLVSRGRHPHQTWFNQWSRSDEGVVDLALKASGIEGLADRPLESLSGGQRQRAWIAMVLAQETDILMLDEPTTFLDLAHSVDVLKTISHLRDHFSRTIVMVLHDINLAARYSDHLIVMKEGAIVADGMPQSVLSADLLREVFSLEAEVITSPVNGCPVILPL